ncbi:RNA polymerase sigma factor [Sphingobacterium sp. LRF_L2]|uniref:RNA polymerase sigma factor n=1 Tax=Sphingobacterium sp. LRF_L2 TaxID=3369421 RepID=UPI003F6064B2
MHIDQKYIQFLLDNNHLGIQAIYKQFAKKVVVMVQRNNGTDDDGFDIFQEVLVDIYHMAKYKEFQLTTSFESFLLLVSKRKWLNELKKRKNKEVTNMDDHVFDIEDDGEEQYMQHILVVEKESLVMETLATLGERCQEIIKRCMTTKNQGEIAEFLGITYAYLRKKKSECMATLANRLKAHPYFKTNKL